MHPAGANGGRARRRVALSAQPPDGLIGNDTSSILIGAGIGATAGALLAANNPRPSGYCTFKDRNNGELYYAPCPPR
jgi:hypothetical protein